MAAARWLVEGTRPAEAASIREAATRAFSPALALGAISSRELLAGAREGADEQLTIEDDPAWGRTSAGASPEPLARALGLTLILFAHPAV